jgi:hypothetical protein
LTEDEIRAYRRARGAPNVRENNMAQDFVQPLQALRAVMVLKRRTLAESLLRSRKGAKSAKRRKRLIKLQKEIDAIDDAIADEQLLSPSLREQLAKEGDADVEPMERVKTRLTELSARLTEAGSAAVSKPGAR